jgi:PIN domain-containing protein
MYIIFDSNIWISELGLNSTLGAAVKFFVKSKRATVVLPEVIKLETERNLKAALTKYLADLEKNHRQLLTVFGQLKEMVLPQPTAVEEKVASIFGACQLELLEIPLSLDSARSSFMKAIDKTPPSDKDQQFKDGVIWAECVRLLNLDDVYLVTEDKAFYKNREYKNGLADALRLEVKDAVHKINLFSSLSAFLKEIRTEVKLDEEALVRQYWDSNKKNIEGMLERNSFAVAGPPKISAELYVTEDANKLYVEFIMSFACDDLLSSGREGIFLLKGDCTYLVQEKVFCSFRSHGEEITFNTEEGEQRSQSGYLYADGLVIGHRTVDHTVKYKITD